MTADPKRTAVVTGLGPVSALGTGVDPFWRALVTGQSGTRRLTRLEPARRGCAVAAEVDDPPPLALDPANPQPRSVQLALAAARLAIADASLDADPERVGVVVGTGVGNLDLIEAALDQARTGERLAPSVAFRVFSHAAACEIARALDLRGPIATLTSGCNSGADALGMALDWIRLARADAVLVGGTEAELSPSFFKIMGAARALAVQHNDSPASASRPFDQRRDGNVPGEGAAFLVVESAEHAARRSARVRAAIHGYASRAAGDRPAYDPFNPAFLPDPMVRAIRGALADAGITARDVSAISANGSSSVFYDVLEATAIAEVFGATEVPVHSIKAGLGQTGAVTPALQAIAAVLTVEHNLIPPTPNVDELDPRCPLAIVRGEPLARPVEYVLAHAIGFGGYYFSAFVVGRPT
ncbi:MAG TPA: beta-ketoacyl synthase N-terminal-like domain-containing protein [Kofleriaceae bacterium]